MGNRRFLSLLHKSELCNSRINGNVSQITALFQGKNCCSQSRTGWWENWKNILYSQVSENWISLSAIYQTITFLSVRERSLFLCLLPRKGEIDKDVEPRGKYIWKIVYHLFDNSLIKEFDSSSLWPISQFKINMSFSNGFLVSNT